MLLGAPAFLRGHGGDSTETCHRRLHPQWNPYIHSQILVWQSFPLLLELVGWFGLVGSAEFSKISHIPSKSGAGLLYARLGRFRRTEYRHFHTERWIQSQCSTRMGIIGLCGFRDTSCKGTRKYSDCWGHEPTWRDSHLGIWRPSHRARTIPFCRCLRVSLETAESSRCASDHREAFWGG